MNEQNTTFFTALNKYQPFSQSKLYHLALLLILGVMAGLWSSLALAAESDERAVIVSGNDITLRLKPIEVQEGVTGHLRPMTNNMTTTLSLVGAVPSSGVTRIHSIEAPQVLDDNSHEIVFGTRNEGASCGGGTPAVAWKMTLDPNTSQATNVTLKQSLSLIQGMRHDIFEGSDGTLFTGSGWCDYTPPYYSKDRGETWQTADQGVSPPNSTFSYVEFQGEVYAGTGYEPHHGQVYRWLGDSGSDYWELVLDIPPPRSVVDTMVVYKDQLFVGSGVYWANGAGCSESIPVYVSPDGNTFNPTTGIPPCYTVGNLLVVGDQLIAVADNFFGSETALYHWQEESQHWFKISDLDVDMGSRLISSLNGAIYTYNQFPGDTSFGVYASYDWGKSWQKIVTLENPNVSTLVTHGDDLYLGTYGDDDDTAYIYRLSPSSHPSPDPPQYRYIKVVDKADKPVFNAEVYRNGDLIGQTNQAGLLSLGLLEIGDELAALALQHEESTVRGQHEGWAYRTFITSVEVDATGNTAPFIVSQPQGEQVLVVRPEQPLIIFNLLVSIEWDATDEYVADIQAAFDAAADFLYDVTDGQMTFGQVAIYDNAEHWTEADIQITTKNVVNPHAFIGGITSEDTSHIIRVGRFWNGNTADQGLWSEPAGYRTLVHEFGHYGLGLYDEYFGYLKVGDTLVGKKRTVCVHKDNRTGDPDASIMDYHYTTSELPDVGRWTLHCQETAQHQLNNGEADWQTMARLYNDHSDEHRWQLVNPDARAGVGQSVPGPEAVPTILPFPVMITTNQGNDPEPFTLQVCYNGAPYQDRTWVTLAKTGGIAMDQGMTDKTAGHIEILGALPDDALRVVSLDNRLSTQQTVEQALARGYLELTPNTKLRALGTTSPPYLRLWPTTDSQGALDGLRLVVERWQAESKLFYALIGSDSLGQSGVIAKGGSSKDVVFLPYAQDGYAKQSGYVNLLGIQNGQTIDLTVDYRLQQTLNISHTSLFSNDGNLELHLEPGSLPLDKVHFLIASPWGLPGSLPTGLAAVGEVYEVTASGNVTSLEKPAVLTFHYDSETMAGFDSDSIAIYQWNPATGTWHPMDTDHSPDDQEVSTVVTDLGIYALLGQPNELAARSHQGDLGACGVSSIYLPVITNF